jgi:hypothetical protein
MKYGALFFVMLMMGLAFAGSAQKKEEFTYPDDIADTAKKAFVKQFNQGKVLYQISCGQCHNKKISGKDIIPDFSLPQLMDYEMRMYEQHENKLDDKHVRDEEMAKIVLFLRYKKKSGVYVTPPPRDPGAGANTSSQ